MGGRRAVGALLAVVAIAAVACGGSQASKQSHPPTSETTSPVSPEVVVDAAATPAGWVPVDYGDAQLSVPADWYVTLDGCDAPNAPGTVMLQPPGRVATPPGRAAPPCFPTTTAGTTASPAVRVGAVATSVPAAGPPPLVINGIVVDVAGETACPASGPCPIWYVVPSLGVEIVDDEIPGERTPVIDTLTHSPRAVALAAGDAAPVPAGWHVLSFGGITVAVPATWSVQTTSNWSGGCGFDVVMDETGVTLDRGTTSILPSCPNQSLGGQPTQMSRDGLVIDPGTYGPLVPDTSFGPCLKSHGLNVCPSASDPYGILVAAVHLHGRVRPVAVEIGLAGTGVTARTILHSLRVA